jgi:hypothetical protein
MAIDSGYMKGIIEIIKGIHGGVIEVIKGVHRFQWEGTG